MGFYIFTRPVCKIDAWAEAVKSAKSLAEAKPGAEYYLVPSTSVDVYKTPLTKEVWINFYQDKNGKIYAGGTYETEAECHRANDCTNAHHEMAEPDYHGWRWKKRNRRKYLGPKKMTVEI